jgi:hypothetical protein
VIDDPDPKNAGQSPASIGLTFNWASERLSAGFVLRPAEGTDADWVDARAPRVLPASQIYPHANDLVLRMYDGFGEVFLNGHVKERQDYYNLGRQPRTRIGFTSLTARPGVKVRITDIWIKRLDHSIQAGAAPPK